MEYDEVDHTVGATHNCYETSYELHGDTVTSPRINVQLCASEEKSTCHVTFHITAGGIKPHDCKETKDASVHP